VLLCAAATPTARSMHVRAALTAEKASLDIRKVRLTTFHDTSTLQLSFCSSGQCSVQERVLRNRKPCSKC
jgi:hypothetical protein